jgi:AhpD family alkylhydroperoxidase
MSRIPIHDLDSAPAASGENLAALRARYGTVLNIHGAMAHAPAVLAGYTGMQAAIADHGHFDARTREAIALAVAAVNGCDYCQAAHTMAGQRAGLSPAQTIAARVGQPIDTRLDALLAVARQATKRIGSVDDATWQAALDAGWTVNDLTDLFAYVLANVFNNFFTHYVGLELDFPAAPDPATAHR